MVVDKEYIVKVVRSWEVKYTTVLTDEQRNGLVKEIEELLKIEETEPLRAVSRMSAIHPRGW